MKRSAFIVFVVLPLLLLSCAALWQSDSAQGYPGGAIPENTTPLSVHLNRWWQAATMIPPLSALSTTPGPGRESTPRRGSVSMPGQRHGPTAAPVRLAAGRINRVVGNYAAALTHLNAALNSADVGVAANFEKALVLEETGKREEARRYL